MFVIANIGFCLRMSLGRMDEVFRIIRIYQAFKNLLFCMNWHDSLLIHRSLTSCP